MRLDHSLYNFSACSDNHVRIFYLCCDFPGSSCFFFFFSSIKLDTREDPLVKCVGA